MTERAIGRGLLYLRQSQGEPTLVQSQYVTWAQLKAAQLGVVFGGKPDDLERMLKANVSNSGDVFVDWNISGNILSRPGWDAFNEKALADHTISHLFVARRDRIARADNPIDAVHTEIRLRQAGLTLVFQDAVAKPFPRGKRLEIGDLIAMVADYDRGGAFRQELARKLIFVKIELAAQGYSIGGDPPYGFRRWLCTAAGVQVRELAKGETVKRPGHHVIWLPTCVAELEVVRRILELIKTTPASQIAELLNAENIPGPRHGCFYTPKNGAPRERSGLWYGTTVRNVAVNPANVFLMTYGKRGSGDAMRFTPKGPRELDDRDFEDERLKQIANPEADWMITAVPGDHQPVIGLEEHREILALVDARGKTQRGKPRAKGANPNPLGARIFDMGCGWPMYRKQRRAHWGYACGLNSHSDSQCCEHNLIDGIAATRFVVAASRQLVLSNAVESKLRARLRELAVAEQGVASTSQIRLRTEAQLKIVTGEVAEAKRKMTLEKDEEIAEAMKSVYKERKAEQGKLQSQLDNLPVAVSIVDPETGVEKAFACLQQMRGLVTASEPEMTSVTTLVKVLNANLYVQFHRVAKGRRFLNLPQSGVLTFGKSSPPVPLWEGRTDKIFVKKMLAEGKPVSAGASQAHCESGDTGTVVGGSGNLQRVTKRCTRPGPPRWFRAARSR